MRLGVSSCLLGTLCRYDGGHAKNSFVASQLQEYFDFVPFCPEADVFGTPRPTIRLVETKNGMRIRTTKNEQDLTETLAQSSKSNALAIEKADICGFILKSKSPTCGLERVKVYFENNPMSEKKGIGLFAEQIKRLYPYLPVEEEGRLGDAWLRENFLMQVFAYADLKEMMQTAKQYKELVDFHTSYKYLIYAKSHLYYKTLGNIVANHDKKPFEIVLNEYQEAFLQAIAKKSTIKKTYNVLLHLFGYFKGCISKAEKEEILSNINDFKRKIVPLITVVRLLQLYTKRFDVEYLKNQKFLQPYPKELALRSNILAYR